MATERELLQALQARGIPTDPTLVRDAISEGGGAFRDWLNLHMCNETLLTKDELDLYNGLQASGELARLATNARYGDIRPRSDLEVTCAIEELKKRTAQIERQCQALKLQHDASEALLMKHRNDELVRCKTDAELHRSWKTESSALIAEIEEVSHNLGLQTAELLTSIAKNDLLFGKEVDRVLHEDDVSLVELQKIVDSIDATDPAEITRNKRLEDLSARLIKHNVEIIRTNLDRVYLEAMQAVPPSSFTGGADATDLKEELALLVTEIVPVAQMSVSQRYLRPDFKARNARHQERASLASAVAEEVCNQFAQRTNRLESYANLVEEHRHQQYALQSLEASLAVTKDAKPFVKDPSTYTTSLPITSLTKSTSLREHGSRRSSISDIAPEDQLIRALGISISKANNGMDTGSSHLLNILEERQAKLATYACNHTNTTESMVSSLLHDSQVALDTLTDSVWAETKHGGLRLVDEEIEEAIALVEREVEELRLVAHEMDVDRLKERNVLKEQFIERWTR